MLQRSRTLQKGIKAVHVNVFKLIQKGYRSITGIPDKGHHFQLMGLVHKYFRCTLGAAISFHLLNYVAFERKTVEDLFATLLERRELFSQLMDM